MKKKFFAIIMLITTACAYQPAQAQYPRVPPAMQAKSDSAQNVEKRRSDAAPADTWNF